MSEPDPEPRPWDPVWAVSTAGATWRAANPPPMADRGRLQERRTFIHLGITLDPPPVDATPRIDAAGACDAFTQHGARIYGPAGPTMHLAVMDGDKLVYSFVADEVALPRHGPAGAASRDAVGTVLGMAVGLLDATTGDWIRQVQSAHGTRPRR